MSNMKILKEIVRAEHLTIYFEHNDAVFCADLSNKGVLGFTECMIFKAHKTNDGYEVCDWNELYCNRDIPFNFYSLLECIKEFCKVTDGVTNEVTDGD